MSAALPPKHIISPPPPASSILLLHNYLLRIYPDMKKNEAFSIYAASANSLPE